VNLFRRRKRDPKLDEARDAFRKVASELDAAQRTLLAAVPTARASGVSLADAVQGYLDGLERLESHMLGWRIPSTEESWQKCAQAIAESGTLARGLASQPEGLEFEALNARLGEVIAPLEEFAYAALSLRG